MAVHPNSLANLKRYSKGKSGNPSGKRKGSVSLTRLLREALEADDCKLAKELVRTAIDRAIAGEFAFAKMIWDRIDGPVPTTVHGAGWYTIRNATSWPPGELDDPHRDWLEWRQTLPAADVIEVDLDDPAEN